MNSDKAQRKKPELTTQCSGTGPWVVARIYEVNSLCQIKNIIEDFTKTWAKPEGPVYQSHHLPVKNTKNTA